MKKREIHLEELRAHEFRREGPPTNLDLLIEALEKVDPGGKKAHRLALKYHLRGIRKEFLQLCERGKLGEEMQSALALVPIFGPVNIREKVDKLIISNKQPLLILQVINLNEAVYKG